MSKTITIVGQKGGTGKSSTAVNLAASLALLEQKTLLIDCDPQGCSTKWCGMKEGANVAGITGLLSGQARPADALAKTGMDCLDVMPSGFRLFLAGLKLAKNPGNEKILRLFLKDIQGEYDYIIIDAQSSYSFLSIMAMTAADSLLICMTPDQNTFEDFQSLLRMVKYIRDTHDVPLKIAGLLFNRCETQDRIISFLEAQEMSDIEEMVLGTFIPPDNTIPESARQGKPCALLDLKAPAATAYLNSAKEIHRFFK